ncbi:MAG: RagB/SusD family nutrient uptake outer membrane protein [Chitinophagaceae bacterium]
MSKIKLSDCLLPIVIIGSLAFASCKKFADIPSPTDQFVSEIVFEDDATAKEAVTGIYADMINFSNTQFSSSGISLYTDLCADNLSYYTAGARQLEFLTNNITSANHDYISQNFWDRAYKYIYTANLCMEGLSKLKTNVTPAVKTMLMGECKFIRAFCFFQLVNLFGPVPKTIGTDYRVNEMLGRASVENIYALIKEDLLYAQEMLSMEYPSAGRVRPNKAAATAFLARVYLYLGDWVNAETEASKVIESGKYSLENDLSRVFLDSSKEAIWQLRPVSSINNTSEGLLILPGSGSAPPTYTITNDLYDSFEATDLRKSNWIASRMFNSVQINYPFKYKIKTGNPVKEYYMVFRLAEQYLIRAEARAQLDKTSASLADLDVIRFRAGFTIPMTAVDKADLLLKIEKERRLELFAEWGHRWFDLKRTHRVDAVIGTYKSTWKPDYALWPIPVAQLRANENLEQNPGY